MKLLLKLITHFTEKGNGNSMVSVKIPIPIEPTWKLRTSVNFVTVGIFYIIKLADTHIIGTSVMKSLIAMFLVAYYNKMLVHMN